MGTHNIDGSVVVFPGQSSEKASAGFSRMVFEQKLSIDKKERKKEGYQERRKERKGGRQKGAFQDVENLPFSSASDVSAPDV